MATILLQHPPVPGETYARRINGNVTGNGYNVNSIGQVLVDVRDEPQFLTKGYIPVGSPLGNNGIAQINFGAFPGSPQASTTVSGVDVNDPNSVVSVWVIPIATTDHSADEHIADPPRVNGYADGNGNIIINAYPSGRDLFVPARTPFGQSSTSQQPVGQIQCMPYGQWSVAWTVAP
jgi:hypothetical protein